MFDIFLFLAIRYPGSDQDSARPEPEDRGPAPGALLHLHPLRAPLPPRDAPEGGHVQVKTQAGLWHCVLRSTGSGGKFFLFYYVLHVQLVLLKPSFLQIINAVLSTKIHKNGKGMLLLIKI